MPLYYYGPKVREFRKLIAAKELIPRETLSESLPCVRLSSDPVREACWTSEVRIVIDDSIPVLTYDEWAEQSGFSALRVLNYLRLANKAQCDQATWRYALVPIPASYWLAVEAKNDAGEWIAYKPIDETQLPEGLRALAGAIENSEDRAIHYAYERVVEEFQRVNDTIDDTVGDVRLSFAAMAHNLQATTNELATAKLQKVDENSLTFEERQALARLRAGHRDSADLATLLPRMMQAFGISW